MMDGWHRVSCKRPCPICGKPDNCEVSDDESVVWCGRVEEGSIQQNAGGQFLHRLNGDEESRNRSRVVAKPKSEPPRKPNVDWQALAKVWFGAPSAASRREELASQLGVSAKVLRALCVGFDGSAWTIPERDGAGIIIGINRRLHDGRKLRMKGSSSGLTFAKGWDRSQGPIFLPEGASDVAALLTLELNAVGRPSNTAGTEMLAELLRSIPNDQLIVVLAENDRKPAEKLRATHRADCQGCSQCWPGRYGAVETAKKLSVALDRTIHFAFPPDGAKDVRDWLQKAHRHWTLNSLKASGADAPVGLQASIADALVSPDMPSVLRRHFLDALKLDSINIELPPVEQPAGPVVSLDDWREQLRTRRVESVGQPGINLDRSGTGYGKTFADFAAIEAVVAKGGRALVVLPTHENCDELETDLTDRGIDAMAYPGRLTEGDDQNCWNPEADVAQAMGLSAVAAVCPACPERKRCSRSGYLHELKLASEATVAIATHNRAIYAGLGTLSTGRGYVAIHEDSLNVLRPSCSVKEADLVIAFEVLVRLVNEPKWLDWYGDILRYDDGKLIGNAKLRQQRREALREFAILLNEVCDRLLLELAVQPGRTRRLTTPKTAPKAIGIERLLYRATGEAWKAGHPFSGSVWRLVLAVATGEIADLGVIVDGPANKLTERRKADQGNLDEHTNRKRDCLVV